MLGHTNLDSPRVKIMLNNVAVQPTRKETAIAPHHGFNRLHREQSLIRQYPMEAKYSHSHAQQSKMVHLQ